MITGKVKFFDMTKGFGFIAPNDGSKDVFVHISALQRSGIDKLVDNQVVNLRSLKSVASRQRLTCRWHKPPLFSVKAVLNEHGFFVCGFWLVISLG